METSECNMDLKSVKYDLLKGIHECSQRGLNLTVKWLAELNYSISDVHLPPEKSPQFINDCEDEMEVYLIAKSYFDLKEYDRCAYFTSECMKPKPRFLHLYAQYLSIEKKKLDNMIDTNCPPDPAKNDALGQLCTVLKNDFYENKLDGYCLYLYGVILRKLDLTSLAIEAFIKAINDTPIIWAAWQELGQIMPDKNKLNASHLPDHWIKQFFLAHTYLEQLNNDEALQMYSSLCDQGFSKSTYLMAQTAIVHHNRRGGYHFL